MTALAPALSLSNKLLEVGALAAFAALVGIALLSLLVFAQARELRRLREWAGRAPERAAELERRVAAEVALRAQRAVPRAKPLIARPLAAPADQTPLPAEQVLPKPTIEPLPAPLPGQPAFIPTLQTVAAPEPVEESQPAIAAPEPLVVAAAPATVAAVAAVSATVASQAVADPPPPIDPPRAPVPPAPADARPVPAAPRAPVPSRSALPPPPSPATPRRTVARIGAGANDEAPRMPATPKFLVEEERHSRRPLLLIAAGAVVAAALAVVLLSGGGGSPGAAKTPAANARGHGAGGRSHAHTAAASGPGQIRVVVLNATETTGLAHALASSLRGVGYSRAQALSARPPSARSSSIVEYTGGHRSEAQRVAQSLSIAETAPLEEAIGPLVEGASVVVIAGADKASAAAAAGEASPGEAPAGGSGEATGAAASGAAGGGEAASANAEAPAGEAGAGEAAAGGAG